MALKFHMPVYFCRQRRLRRGYYELEFLRLYDGVEQVAPNEVTGAMCDSSKATSSPIRGCGSGRIAVGNTVVRNVRRKDRHTQLERSRPSAALPSLGGAHRSAGGGDRRGGQRFDRRVGGARRAGVSVGYVAPAAGKLRFRRRLQPRVGAVGGRLLGAAQLRRRTCGGGGWSR